jgi:hypothetical protein
MDESSSSYKDGIQRLLDECWAEFAQLESENIENYPDLAHSLEMNAIRWAANRISESKMDAQQILRYLDTNPEFRVPGQYMTIKYGVLASEALDSETITGMLDPILDQLKNGLDWYFCYWIASNPNTPSKYLDAIAEFASEEDNEDFEILEVLIENPNTSKKTKRLCTELVE